MLARDLRLAGVSDKEVLLSRRRGLIDRELQGVYLLAGLPRDRPMQARVAIAHAGDGAVLTGLYGAQLQQLPWIPEPTQIQVLVGPECRRAGSAAYVLVRRCCWLEEIEPRWINGLPVASVAQVVVDGARELRGLRDVRGVVLGAIAARRCSVEEIEELLARSASAGTALARRACRDARRGAASPPEAELGDAFAGSGVPHYLNCEIWLDGVLLGVADLWLVGTGTGGELDSKQFHADDERLDATLSRHDRFEKAGLSLEHRSPTRFRADPAAFVRALLQEAARRQAQGISEPRGLELRPRGPLLF